MPLVINSNAIRRSGGGSGKRDALVRSGLGLQLQSFTVAELAAAPNLPAQRAGALVACSNGAAGSACLAFSNGTAWKVVAIGATAAAS